MLFVVCCLLFVVRCAVFVVLYFVVGCLRFVRVGGCLPFGDIIAMLLVAVVVVWCELLFVGCWLLSVVGVCCEMLLLIWCFLFVCLILFC